MRYRFTVEELDDNGVVTEACVASTDDFEKHTRIDTYDVGCSIRRALQGVGLPRVIEAFCVAIYGADSYNVGDSSGVDGLDDALASLDQSCRDVIDVWARYDKKMDGYFA